MYVEVRFSAVPIRRFGIKGAGLEGKGMLSGVPRMGG